MAFAARMVVSVDDSAEFGRSARLHCLELAPGVALFDGVVVAALSALAA